MNQTPYMVLGFARVVALIISPIPAQILDFLPRRPRTGSVNPSLFHHRSDHNNLCLIAGRQGLQTNERYWVWDLIVYFQLNISFVQKATNRVVCRLVW